MDGKRVERKQRRGADAVSVVAARCQQSAEFDKPKSSCAGLRQNQRPILNEKAAAAEFIGRHQAINQSGSALGAQIPLQCRVVRHNNMQVPEISAADKTGGKPASAPARFARFHHAAPPQTNRMQNDKRPNDVPECAVILPDIAPKIRRNFIVPLSDFGAPPMLSGQLSLRHRAKVH